LTVRELNPGDMKFIDRWRLLTLIVLAGGLLGVRAGTPAIAFTVSASTNLLTQNNPVTYTFTLTNNLGANLDNLVVTNTFSSPVTVTNYYTPQGTGSLVYVTITNSFIFDLGNLLYPTNRLQFYLTVVPQSLGLVTNSVVLTSTGTNVVATNLVTQVVNAQADLSVFVTSLVPVAYPNDWLTCGFTVSNAGPGNVTSVMLTNTLPAGLGLLGVPTGQTYTIVSNTVWFSLGTLNSGASQAFQLLLQPTNSGAYPLNFSAGAPGLLDPYTNNNTVITNLTVTSYPATLLVAVTNSGQVLDRQNGLLEQSIGVTNAGPGNAPAVRVIVTGLTHWLFNATGTNNGNPYVVCPAPLNTNQGVSLLLQYYVTNRSSFAFSNGQLQAYAVARPNLKPTAATGFSTNHNLLITRLANGRMLLAFPAQTGSNYTLIYADNVLFSNAQTVQPPVLLAPTNSIQWIDYGPPGTASQPTNSPRRFYRVYRNP